MPVLVDLESLASSCLPTIVWLYSLMRTELSILYSPCILAFSLLQSESIFSYEFCLLFCFFFFTQRLTVLPKLASNLLSYCLSSLRAHGSVTTIISTLHILQSAHGNSNSQDKKLLHIKGQYELNKTSPKHLGKYLGRWLSEKKTLAVQAGRPKFSSSESM